MPLGFLELKAEAPSQTKANHLILTCGGGRRGQLAAALNAKWATATSPFSMVAMVRGPMLALPVETPFVLSDEDRSRYARHLNIPEVGPEGQAKLLQAACC